ncbi:MAG: peptidylprolyl isomerase [Pseudomonadales bacterium]|nr:peptidylprolyl isomerase [Pseudomonadales bacterium]NRA17826.1 peptidylprolyl isomerase [Oceanospirillaceae bacterium]
MKIAQDTVVQFNYVLKDADGNILEETDTDQPLLYLQGHNNMLEGVEKALAGHAKGDSVTVTLAPEQAYGKVREDAVIKVPVKHLQGAKKWRPGMVATVNTEKGQHQVTIVKMGRFMASVDTNHPFAGKTLTFDMQVVDVRQATANEVSHRHAHGAGGHQH